MLSLSNALRKAQQVQWSFTNSFSVTLNLEETMAGLVGWNNSKMPEILNLSIKNVDIPQHTADLIEKIIAGEWHFSRNEDEIFVVTLTFRDMYNGALYRLFKSIWSAAKVNYMDKSKFSLSVDLVAGKKNSNGKDSATIFYTDAAYMTSISQLQLSHENSEILEFSVEFKTNEPLCDMTEAITSIDGSYQTIDQKETKNKVSYLLESASKRAMREASKFAKETASSWGTSVGEALSSWDF